MAFDIIHKLYVTAIFIEAAVDPVGHKDRTEDLTSKNYDENIRCENSVEITSGKGRDEEETLGLGHQVEQHMSCLVHPCRRHQQRGGLDQDKSW